METLDFDALLTTETVMEKEDKSEAGFLRRAMLMTLTFNKSDLVEKFNESEESRETLLETIDMLSQHKKLLESLIEMNETAIARLIVVGQDIHETAA